MKVRFADTSYYIALLNRKDQMHGKALELSNLADRLVTTEWVLTELANSLSSSVQRSFVVEARASLYEDHNAVVVPLSMELQERGFALFASRPDKAWSLTDCISFEVMRDEGITEALTADHHFEQAGFVTLLK